MTPDTVHFLAQQIRHIRGLLAVGQAWEGKQHPDEMNGQSHEVTRFWRDVLRFAEDRLSHVTDLISRP
jgi:hypothetical protein